MDPNSVESPEGVKADDTKSRDAGATDGQDRAPAPTEPSSAPKVGARTSLLLSALFVATAGTSVMALWSPRAVEPSELPGLVLDPAAVAASIRADVTDAQHAPRGAEVDALDRLYIEQGYAETITDTPREADRRRRDIIAARTRVAALRENAVPALRARAVLEYDAIVARTSQRADRAAFLGSIATMFDRYNVTDHGRPHAPRFVARTIFKARWNAVMQLQPIDGLRPIELRAFAGWLALGAESAPLAARRSALDEYARVGGPYVEEAKAIFAIRAGELDAATESFLRAGTATGNLRFRNYLLALASTRVDTR